MIRSKFKSAGYPTRFVNSVINEFTIAQINEYIELIILPWLFEVKKKIVLVEILYCLKNEGSPKQFIKKFTNDTFDVRIKWLTKNVKILFRVKDKSLHQDCRNYKDACLCDESYIGKTIRNFEVL